MRFVTSNTFWGRFSANRGKTSKSLLPMMVPARESDVLLKPDNQGILFPSSTYGRPIQVSEKTQCSIKQLWHRKPITYIYKLEKDTSEIQSPLPLQFRFL